MDIKRDAFERAKEVLRLCSTPHGFFAAYPGYDMVFARDAMIISLGASLLKDEKMKETVRRSLVTLAENQSAKGQIPNAVDKYSRRKHHVDYLSIDSTLWFLICSYIYKKRYKDSSFSKKYRKNITRALQWLNFQDLGEDKMLVQQPTTDWQDCFPHKYGHTINTQALYYEVLRINKKFSEAKKLKKKTNDVDDVKLWKGQFYLPWRWKNHNDFKEEGHWFDSLGNLLAIIFGLADKNKAEKILSYIREEKIDKPYPIRVIHPPIKRNSRYWRNYFRDCEARTAYHYLNGAVWTYVGGFYVLALIKSKKFREAKKQLKKLAEANMTKPYFTEWLHGKTGRPGRSGSGKDGNQGWNAGMYILAYESLKNKKCLI